MDKKTGVYVCSGCGIGDALNIEKLCELSHDHIQNNIGCNSRGNSRSPAFHRQTRFMAQIFAPFQKFDKRLL